jgi:hypothetical protein
MKPGQIHPFPGVPCGGAWIHAPPLFCGPEAFPAVPWSFRGYYVILFVWCIVCFILNFGDW